MFNIDIIRTKVRFAIKKAASEIKAQNYDLAGFALGTDDDVSSLFAVVCSKQWVAENGKKMGLQFNEWSDYMAESEFNKVSRQLFDISTNHNMSDDEWLLMRDKLFELIVQEFVRAKKQYRINDDVFLCVGSTDPSDYMLSLELNGVQQLNNKLITQSYQKLISI